ncbi:MAG: DegT/DnrJ/EryC1/StrS family aminotransferase [Candidatus Marinamargulisbacteria bacterium]
MSTQTINKVPLLDLQAQYEPIKDDVISAITDVFNSKQFIQGPKVVELETMIKEYCGVKHAIGVSSGTDALIVSLMAMGIGYGDEVITTPFTFFATGGSIHRVGAKPVFVDIDPETYNIDVNQIESKITDKTKAIMPVHLFGQVADMKQINEIAKVHNLFVIEDAAQAIGAKQTIDGKTHSAGSMGSVGCFSFFPSKNLGGCGDGGIVTTNDDELGEKIRLLRTHGAKERYYHDHVGGNFRLDPIQAAVLCIKLPHLNSQHEGRRKNADFYNTQLNNVVTPIEKDGNWMIYNQYTIRTKKRDELIKHLSSHNIGNAIYYPLPLHLQKCFDYLGYKEGDLPHAEQAAKEVLSLPVYSELSTEQLDYVIDKINQF